MKNLAQPVMMVHFHFRSNVGFLVASNLRPPLFIVPTIVHDFLIRSGSRDLSSYLSTLPPRSCMDSHCQGSAKPPGAVVSALGPAAGGARPAPRMRSGPSPGLRGSLARIQPLAGWKRSTCFALFADESCRPGRPLKNTKTVAAQGVP